VFDAGYEIREGYLEAAFTADRHPFRSATPLAGSTVAPRVNWVGMYQHASLDQNHSRDDLSKRGDILYLRTGNVPRAFSKINAFSAGTKNSCRYHALQTTLRSRFAAGMTASANYTYASNISYNAGDIRSFSTPQDNNNIRSDRGPTPFHIRHRFVTDFIYELPFAKLFSANSRAEKLLFGGWQFAGIFTAQSGAAADHRATRLAHRRAARGLRGRLVLRG